MISLPDPALILARLALAGVESAGAKETGAHLWEEEESEDRESGKNWNIEEA